MARSVKSKLDSRSSRARLPAASHPYWTRLEPGLFVGYYKPLGGGAGTWWGRVAVDGRYKQESLRLIADDHQDADGERVLSWAQAQAAVRTWAAKRTDATGYTVNDATRDYMADLHARKGERAAREAYGRLVKHLLPIFGERRRLADLTSAELLAWRNGLVNGDDSEEGARKSRDTANRVLGIAKAVFNLAVKTGRVPSDDAWRRLGSFRGVGVARKVILSEEEIRWLIAACPPGLRELVTSGALTGARLGELTGAQVRDFHPADATLDVRGKTGARTVHLPPAALQLLLPLARKAKGRDTLLLTAPDGAPWGRSRHSDMFAAAVTRAGLNPETVFYSLRHSYISRGLVAGVPTQALAKQCGTSATMIERHYAKFIAGQLAKYAEMAAPRLA